MRYIKILKRYFIYLIWVLWFKFKVAIVDKITTKFMVDFDAAGYAKTYYAILKTRQIEAKVAKTNLDADIALIVSRR